MAEPIAATRDSATAEHSVLIEHIEFAVDPLASNYTAATVQIVVVAQTVVAFVMK